MLWKLPYQKFPTCTVSHISVNYGLSAAKPALNCADTCYIIIVDFSVAIFSAIVKIKCA